MSWFLARIENQAIQMEQGVYPVGVIRYPREPLGKQIGSTCTARQFSCFLSRGGPKLSEIPGKRPGMDVLLQLSYPFLFFTPGLSPCLLLQFSLKAELGFFLSASLPLVLA